MLSITKFISSELDSLGRRILTVLRNGKSDVQSGFESMPFGVDSNPIKDIRAIYAETGAKGKKVVIGYINASQLAEIGETRIFSTDEEGALQTYIWLKNDGTMHIGGDANFAVKFNELKAAFDELQTDVQTLKNNFTSWVPIANDGGGALKTATATWAGTPFAENINAAKNENIKTV